MRLDERDDRIHYHLSDFGLEYHEESDSHDETPPPTEDIAAVTNKVAEPTGVGNTCKKDMNLTN